MTTILSIILIIIFLIIFTIIIFKTKISNKIVFLEDSFIIDGSHFMKEPDKRTMSHEEYKKLKKERATATPVTLFFGDIEKWYINVTVNLFGVAKLIFVITTKQNQKLYFTFSLKKLYFFNKNLKDKKEKNSLGTYIVCFYFICIIAFIGILIWFTYGVLRYYC